MSCSSESTSLVWVELFNRSSHKVKKIYIKKSARMYAQVCFTNYLFKLFKKHMSKHPYQYFEFKKKICFLRMFTMNLSCKLTLQSLILVLKSQISSGGKPESEGRLSSITPPTGHFSQCSVKGQLINKQKLYWFPEPDSFSFLLLWRSYHCHPFS